MVKRLEFVDLAKGICIMLVVLYHLQFAFNAKIGEVLGYTSIFRMPLYFFLSGLFFKEYDGFLSFVKKKTNNLLVPFFSFYIVFTVFLPNMFVWLGILNEGINSCGWHTIWQFVYPEYFFNNPIWFLLCLFELNIYFYLLVLFVNKKNIFHVQLSLLASSIALGWTGYKLGPIINLPAFLDTALTALPFFCTGYLSRNWLKLNYMRIPKYLLILVSLISLFLLYTFPGKVLYRSNIYEISCIHLYLMGLSGILFILSLSLLLKSIPIINYFGHYSIMILLTHGVLINIIAPIISCFFHNPNCGLITSFIILMLAYLAIIPFMKKYFPYITAQKSLL